MTTEKEKLELCQCEGMRSYMSVPEGRLCLECNRLIWVRDNSKPDIRRLDPLNRPIEDVLEAQGLKCDHVHYHYHEINQVVESPDMMGPHKEVWLPIKDFEGLYEVSNYGRIKSLSRTIYRKNGHKYSIKDRIRKLHVGVRGYHVVTLLKDKKTHVKTTHRLIAKAFIHNPDNLPYINHIDGNKLNNQLSNLEWCTCQENIQHAYDTGLKIGPAKGKFGDDNPSSKAVLQINKTTGEIINRFGSAREATRKTGIGFSKIGQVCLGRRKTSGGYKWRFADD